MPVTLVVETDGSATVQAGVDPARESFRLGDEELQQLQDELEAGLASDAEPGPPSGCADCYVWEVTYGGEVISFDESQEVPAALGAVVTHLNQITVEHFPTEATDPPIVN
jgi:hypothetical protein